MKDALGHGSNGRGGSDQKHEDWLKGRRMGYLDSPPSRAQTAMDRVTDEDARRELSSGGPKSAAPSAHDAFWSYRASSPTPTHEQAIAAGKIHPSTTREQWEQMSPGMRREIMR